jgi:hypothetical protein
MRLVWFGEAHLAAFRLTLDSPLARSHADGVREVRITLGFR